MLSYYFVSTQKKVTLRAASCQYTNSDLLSALKPITPDDLFRWEEGGGECEPTSIMTTLAVLPRRGKGVERLLEYCEEYNTRFR